MNDKNTYSVDKYLEIIAEKEGITKEEVQQEIGRAVSIALKSPDPKMQRFWTDFPCENDTPTIEEIIYHLAEKFAIDKGQDNYPSIHSDNLPVLLIFVQSYVMQILFLFRHIDSS